MLRRGDECKIGLFSCRSDAPSILVAVSSVAPRTCPADLKEAVSSIVFAAPRAAEIPELMEVRPACQMDADLQWSSEYLRQTTCRYT